MSGRPRMDALRLACRTNKGMAWAAYSHAVKSCIAEPTDSNAALVRVAFNCHVQQYRDRAPNAEEYAAVETLIGRTLPPVLASFPVEAIRRARDELAKVLAS